VTCGFAVRFQSDASKIDNRAPKVGWRCQPRFLVIKFRALVSQHARTVSLCTSRIFDDPSKKLISIGQPSSYGDWLCLQPFVLQHVRQLMGRPKLPRVIAALLVLRSVLSSSVDFVPYHWRGQEGVNPCVNPYGTLVGCCRQVPTKVHADLMRLAVTIQCICTTQLVPDIVRPKHFVP
jgi:hypothetical protein